MKIKTAICDDEKMICDEIKSNIQNLSGNYEISVFYSGEELLNDAGNYDLIFLDIEMPKLDGMQTANILREKNKDIYIIFLTSHTELMPEAFKVKAYRFLCKPVDAVQLKESLYSVEKEIFNDERILVEAKNRTKSVRLRDIVYFEAFGDGTYIYTKDEVIESASPLKYWVKKIGEEHFFQCHKSYFLSLRYVNEIGDTYAALSESGIRVPVSRRKKTKLKEAVLEYVRSNGRVL